MSPIINFEFTQMHLTQGLLIQARYKLVSKAFDSMSPIIYIFQIDSNALDSRSTFSNSF